MSKRKWHTFHCAKCGATIYDSLYKHEPELCPNCAANVAEEPDTYILK